MTTTISTRRQAVVLSVVLSAACSAPVSHLAVDPPAPRMAKGSELPEVVVDEVLRRHDHWSVDMRVVNGTTEPYELLSPVRSPLLRQEIRQGEEWISAETPFARGGSTAEVTLPPGQSLAFSVLLLGHLAESRVCASVRAVGSDEWVDVWSRPFSAYGPEPPEDGGWLTRRRHAGSVQTNADRIGRILVMRERFEGWTPTGPSRVREAYLLATYCVATHLDFAGRTSAPDGEAGDDEWEVSTESARYVFPKDEFPIYGRLRALRSSERRPGDSTEPLTQKECEALAALADDAIALLRRER